MLEKTRRALLHRTIRFDLMVALMIVALLPATIINSFYFTRMNTVVEERIKSYNNEIIKQAGQKVEFLLEQTELTKRQLIATAITSKLFDDYDEMPALEKVEYTKKTEDILTNGRRSLPAIADIYLITSKNQAFSSNTDFSKSLLLRKSWVQELIDLDTNDMTLATHSADYDNMNERTGQRVVTFLKKVVDAKNGSYLGIIQIDLMYAEVKKIMESADFGEKSAVYIYDADGSIIYSNDEKYLDGNIREIAGFKQSSFTVTYDLSNCAWSVSATIPTDALVTGLKELGRLSVVITVISLAFSIFISYTISAGITKPLKKVINTMKKVGDGRFDITVPDMNNKDLQVLSSSFNIMVNKINLLMTNIIEKEQEKTDAELKALQAQINPHFLYNTLNIIKWMALMENSQTVPNAIVALVKVLEFSCRNSDRLIPFTQEMEFIENFIYIMKMRYGSNIEFRFEIQEEVFRFLTMKFILQPIIENAIIHGLSERDYIGRIVIRGRLWEDRLEFEVEDNGVGIHVNEKEKFTGLGIHNINTRIKLNFGEQYGLNIFSRPGTGTKITVTIPRMAIEEVGA